MRVLLKCTPTERATLVHGAHRSLKFTTVSLTTGQMERILGLALDVYTRLSSASQPRARKGNDKRPHSSVVSADWINVDVYLRIGDAYCKSVRPVM